jgi:adenylate cyclase
MRHIIDAQRDFADEVLIRPLVESGMSPSEILAVSSARRRSYREMGQRLINLLFVRLADEAVFQNVVEHMEAALADKRLRIGEHTGAIAFMDVSGYTRMTEEAGDEEAVTEALRFIELVESVAAETGGRIVKVLGDGVMTHFDDADGAVRAAVLLVGRSYTAGLPAARAGINTGPMLRRDGDYFGSVVNIAARAADYARPREVLVTDAVVEAWTGGNSFNFQGIGAVALKNVRKRIELYRAAPETPLE